MSFSSEMATTANELLAEFGQLVLVTNFEAAVEDPVTGVVTPVSSQYTTTGVLLDYDYRNFGESTVAYQAVNASDKRLIMSATKTVNTGDTVYVDSTLYKCHVVKCVSPAGTRILYDIWVQK